MVAYILLITGDADRWWSSATDADRALADADYVRFVTALLERGHRVTGGAQLRPPAEARRLRPEPVTAGPFAETTEQVAGFMQVESDDLDDLVDCCRILVARGAGIDVREVVPEPRAARDTQGE